MSEPASLIDLVGFGSQGWGYQLIYGAGMTLAISSISYAIGLSLGLLGAIAKLSRSFWANLAGNVYTTVIRAVPEILLILLIYYSATSAVRELGRRFGLSAEFQMNGLLAASLSLGVVQGGYSTEVLRGAIQAVPRGQVEAALSLDLSRMQTFILVVAPQMLRHALPGLGNLWLVVLKESSLISIIGFTELLLVGKMAAGSTHDYFFFYSVVGLIFLFMSGVSVTVFLALEQRLAIGSRR